ncbi:DUF1109 domain-containing protein [Qipengyuania sp. 6B39]|uniref:DUF1109 domain-containing protein n=1 Tax=Qipengyuania proteolytica TaxID=2867239 RepID=UPI001C896CC7|nr:DUF1109 domain-containing protein [Qipengyuania proteolytica]MBX7494985.1 DUF1109 domain-containing protein [Qipengyuania proteolytica]
MTMNPETGRISNSLIDDLAADLAPVRPVRLVHGIALVALAAIATVVLVELIDGLWRGILAGRASALFFIANGMLGLLGAASALAVLRMATPRVGNSHEGARWSFAMLGLLPATAVVTLGIGGSIAEILGDPYGFECFAAGTGFGLVTAAALVLWLRRGAPVSLAAAGTFTGVAAGAIGSFAYGLACPIDTLGHLGVWHVLPVALAALVGRLAVPPLVRW